MYFNICTNLDILIIIHTTNMYMRQAVYLHCIFAISVANLNLFYPKMLFAKIGRNLPKGFIEKIFKISSMYFTMISPWKGHGPSFKQTFIPNI